MNSSTEQDNDKDNSFSYEQPIKIKLPKQNKYSQSPLEQAIIEMLSKQVLEDDSVKWEALSEAASSFNELGDILEKYSKNLFFQKDMNNPDRKDSFSKIADHMRNLIDAIEKTKASIYQEKTVLGDIIISLLQHPLNMLQERADKAQNMAAEEDPEKTKEAFNQFENYRIKFFSEISQVLNFSHDPFLTHEDIPFEKQMTDILLDALKVPTIPEIMLWKYIKDDDQIEDFKKYYKFSMNIEVKMYKKKFEDEINSQKAILTAQKEQLKNSTHDKHLEETVEKEYKYWNNMTPEKLYEQLLRLRTFELLKSSAGKKRLTPEFMYKLYSEMRTHGL